MTTHITSPRGTRRLHPEIDEAAATACSRFSVLAAIDAG